MEITLRKSPKKHLYQITCRLSHDCLRVQNQKPFLFIAIPPHRSFFCSLHPGVVHLSYHKVLKSFYKSREKIPHQFSTYTSFMVIFTTCVLENTKSMWKSSSKNISILHSCPIAPHFHKKKQL